MVYNLIYSIFTFPASIYLRYLKFTVSDGIYESNDESIWSDGDEKTTDEMHNYSEHSKFILPGNNTNSIYNCLMKCLKLSILECWVEISFQK